MIYILIWIACALIGAVIGSKKGEAGSGFLIGLVFGPLGVIFALLSTGNRKPCLHCKEPIHKNAAICPHCRTALSTQVAS